MNATRLWCVSAAGDLTQLVIFWLYSNISARLLSGYAIFQLNCHPIATISLFLEEFLNFCFKSMRFWVNCEVVNVNFYVCIWQHICNFCWFITADYSINTKRPNLIANWSQTDSILLPLYCPLETTKLIWRQRPSSKHSFHRQETGSSLHTLTVILVILWS